MRINNWALVGFVFTTLLAASCTRDRASTCVTNEECETGACDLVTNLCVAMPSGDGGADVGMAGMDGAASEVMASDVMTQDSAGTCASNGDCGGAKPICGGGGLCVACGADAQCASGSAATPLCEVASGKCVACLQSSQCGEAAPICVEGACVACNAIGVVATACNARSAAKPVCESSTGKCVECVGSGDCGAASKPICSQNTCRACSADAECVAKAGASPGVCMAHDDGRCAAAGEMIFVENVTAKCANTSPGTAAMPLCGLQEGINAAKAGGKALVVLKGPEAVFGASYAGPGKLAVVGQGGAIVGPGAAAGLSVTAGELYVRAIAIEGGIKQGAVVNAGATLQLDGAMVRNNKGGGLLVDGGTLVLTNSTISGNGPGDLAGILWGGIRLTNATVATRLDRVSVLDNKAPGISCSASVQGAGVLATGNSTANISMSCSITSCPSASATCGAP